MKILILSFAFLLAMLSTLPISEAAPRKPHVISLSGTRKVPYSRVGDPAGAVAGEESLKIRALLLDGVQKEWTTSDVHDVTDRSFVVRRAIRLNDALPGESATAKKQSSWVWQRGPWLLVDRLTGRVTALKLPDYDPGVSQVSWFRDYAAYCGLTASGKSLYAVVAQLSARKPLLSKKLAPFDAGSHPDVVCAATEWQREPMRVTFHATGKDAVGFDIVPGSAVLVEDGGDEPDAPAADAKPN